MGIILMVNKYFIIILLITYILLKVNRFLRKKNALKEGFTGISTHQNADKLLENLSKSDSVSLLVSNNIIMPWVKNMEINQAENIDNNYTIKDAIYGISDSENNIILEPIEGIDKQLDKLITNKKDIYEYVAFVNFLEKNNYVEIDNWGRQLGFNLVRSSGTNIITSVINPSLKSLKAKKTISLKLPEVTDKSSKYNFKLSEVINEPYDLSKMDEKDYKL